MPITLLTLKALPETFTGKRMKKDFQNAQPLKGVGEADAKEENYLSYCLMLSIDHVII